MWKGNLEMLHTAKMDLPTSKSHIEIANICAIPESPTADLGVLWNLGVAGVPIPQYLRWADDAGLIQAMVDHETITSEQILQNTSLSKRGIDALLGVLCSLHLVNRVEKETFQLSDIARQYLDPRSSYYVGSSLYGMLKAKFPARLRKGEKTRHFSKATSSLWHKIKYFRSSTMWGRPERLRFQHSRNFPAAVVASRSAHFDGLTHLIDIGGGTGVFSIPLALERPGLRITLVELPNALPHLMKYLKKYNVEDKVELQGIDVHKMPWPFTGVDGILFGNFMHFCSDEECLAMLKESHRLLSSGGRVLLHEMLWNDNKDGPLVTALWNFWLTSVSAGRQRTRSEFSSLLRSAGFAEPTVTATLGGFSLLVGTKISGKGET